MSEILDHIGKWSRGEASISEVLNLIGSWASGVEKECSSSDYVVVSRKGSSFQALATYYAEKKNARLLNYSTSIDEIIPELANLSPTYLALVLPPEDLTPDYMDHVDEKLRELDSDPFLDVAYGYITSFNLSDGYDYVNKLLDYKTPMEYAIHGINTGFQVDRLDKWYGLNITKKCIEGGFGLSVCDDTTRASVTELSTEAKKSSILLWNIHGSPSYMSLNMDGLTGSKSGLIGERSNDTDVPIPLNASLVVAMSCNTARINGKPSQVMAYPIDSDDGGDVNSSIALSFLKSGTLNYIGSTHLANDQIMPDETIIPESIIRGYSIGTALKDFKNRYIQQIILGTNQSVRDFIAFELRDWVLLGDPSAIISRKTITPMDCIKEYSEVTQEKNINGTNYLVKESKAKIRFYINNSYLVENTFVIYGLDFDSGTTEGYDACALNIPLEGGLVDYNISADGMNPRYNSYLTEKSIVENAGDELLVMVPSYFVPYHNEYVELDFSIIMKE